MTCDGSAAGTSLNRYRGFPTRMVNLHYISCLRNTILVGNPRYVASPFVYLLNIFVYFSHGRWQLIKETVQNKTQLGGRQNSMAASQRNAIETQNSFLNIETLWLPGKRLSPHVISHHSKSKNLQIQRTLLMYCNVSLLFRCT